MWTLWTVPVGKLFMNAIVFFSGVVVVVLELDIHCLLVIYCRGRNLPSCRLSSIDLVTICLTDSLNAESSLPNDQGWIIETHKGSS